MTEDALCSTERSQWNSPCCPRALQAYINQWWCRPVGRSSAGLTSKHELHCGVRHLHGVRGCGTDHISHLALHDKSTAQHGMVPPTSARKRGLMRLCVEPNRQEINAAGSQHAAFWGCPKSYCDALMQIVMPRHHVAAITTKVPSSPLTFASAAADPSDTSVTTTSP